MGLARPEDMPALEAAVAEFLKLCKEKGFQPVTILQTSIAVAAAVIEDEADGDRAYTQQLVARYVESLRSVFRGGFRQV